MQPSNFNCYILPIHLTPALFYCFQFIRLWDLKRVIQERKLSSSLFNVAEYVSNLEGLYSAIMRRYEKGKKPCHIIMEDFEDLEMGTLNKLG